ncbi:MAG: hypothetical protein KDD47_16215, partial [Acidobacteria bacterium]|nr:hypothetical protein [Acidobacteriota bacterium]
RAWLRPAGVGSIILGGIALAPLSLPILPLAPTERYVEAITFGAFDHVYELTGDLRGMFGWKERAESVVRAWQKLSPEEQSEAAILTSWYGPAGAIDFFGRPYGLPPATSGHMSYHLWGPPKPFEVAVAADVDPELLAELCEEVEAVERLEFPEANPGDRFWPVAICRRPRGDLGRDWLRYRDWSHD